MIKLGVIGHGARVSGVIRHPLRAACPEVRVVGIVDPDREGARERLAEEDRAEVTFCESVDELVRTTKPDTLMIGTRCNLHTPYAIEAAKYDLPLFLEEAGGDQYGAGRRLGARLREVTVPGRGKLPPAGLAVVRASAAED